MRRTPLTATPHTHTHTHTFNTVLRIGDTSTTASVTPVPCEAAVDEEREFVWDDYLEETGSAAAPATSFKHVRTTTTTTTITITIIIIIIFLY